MSPLILKRARRQSVARRERSGAISPAAAAASSRSPLPERGPEAMLAGSPTAQNDGNVVMLPSRPPKPPPPEATEAATAASDPIILERADIGAAVTSQHQVQSWHE
jgi:hypothetical protein